MARPCKSCNEPLIWAKSVTTGKNVPLNATMVLGGEFQFSDINKQTVVATSTPPVDRPGYRSHFVTCPARNLWRAPARDDD